MLEAPEIPLEEAHRLDEDERDQPEGRAEGDGHRHDGPVIENCSVRGEGGHGRGNSAHEVGDDAGDQAREEDGILDAPEVEDLDSEEGAGDRRSEHGGEAGADPADHEAAPILVFQLQGVGKKTRDRRADLGARAFLPHRASEGQGEDGGQELHGRHLPVHLPRPSVHRRDHGLGPVALGRGREGADQPDAQRKSDGKKVVGVEGARQGPGDEPSRGSQGPEEGSGRFAHAQSGESPEKGPFQGADDEGGVLAVPVSFAGELGPGGPGAESVCADDRSTERASARRQSRRLAIHQSSMSKNGAFTRSTSVSRAILSRLRLSSRKRRGGRAERARVKPTWTGGGVCLRRRRPLRVTARRTPRLSFSSTVRLMSALRTSLSTIPVRVDGCTNMFSASFPADSPGRAARRLRAHTWRSREAALREHRLRILVDGPERRRRFRTTSAASPGSVRLRWVGSGRRLGSKV